MSKKFNHLNIPSHWQSYWTRFPEGHTILEALIQWVSQVDEMVDNQNKLSDTVSNYGTRLDQFIDQFDGNLSEKVIDTLGEWQQSGFLDIVIDQALDTKYHEMDDRLTTQLAHNAKFNRVGLSDTKLVGHRGFSQIAPENTLPAYELAGDYGFWGAECDIVETKDGYFVLMHDLTLDRTTSGTGNVKDFTLAELKQLTITGGNNISDYPNMSIPTLDEFLLICKKHSLVPVIEVKTLSSENVSRLVDVITKYGFETKCVVIGFNFASMQAIRNINKNIYLQPLLNLTSENIDFCVGLGNAGIDAHYPTITKELVDEAHEKGILVNCWTVNDRNIANNLRNMGVDFITTDKILF